MGDLKVRETVLKNGEEITGMVVPIYPAKILLQTDDICLELSETEIQSLDGKEDFRNLIEPPERAIFEAMTVFQYNDDGSCTSLMRRKSLNDSDHILGKLRWLYTTTGEMTEEVEEHFMQQKHFDAFGNFLPFTIESKLENGWEYSVEFPVPVAPGDYYEITYKHDHIGKWAELEDDHWVARYHGRWTSDTIFTLMFMLPQGAKFSSATPQPLRQFDFNGKPVVTWKRYMPKDEPVTYEAKYTL